MSPPKIIVHWLEASRAHRILWLLEELELEYTVKLYKRSDEKRAPEELKTLHPFGKSPLLELEFEDGKKTVLAESGHIINYLISKFDKTGKFKAANDKDSELIDYYLHMSEATLQPPISMLAVLAVGDAKAPFMIRSVVQKYNQHLRTAYNFLEITMVLDYLEDELKKTGGLYFVGGKLSAADIMLVYPVAQVCFMSDRLSEVVTKAKYPNLAKWSDYIIGLPAFQKSVKRVEEQGKGKYSIHKLK
uniref:glutathione transferase n=1 Tax=Cyberlindnera americana TaxID=36016 RepID=A0A5P8N8W8_9ASCO|nr:glutathione S-transferase [Cyberlindnera americana]